MITQAKLKTLVETIKAKTGLSQEGVSLGAGYKRKTLTQRISNGKDLEAVYAQLQLAFKDRLNNSTGKDKKNQPQKQDDLQSLIKGLTEKLDEIATNSSETNWITKSILTSQHGYGRALAGSLDKLNEDPEGTTAAAADTIDLQIWKMLEQKGIGAIVRK